MDSDEDVDQLPIAQRRHMLEGVAHAHERKGSAVLPPHGDVDDDNDGMPMDEDEFEDDFSLWELFKPMGKALGKNIILVYYHCHTIIISTHMACITCY